MQPKKSLVKPEIYILFYKLWTAVQNFDRTVLAQWANSLPNKGLKPDLKPASLKGIIVGVETVDTARDCR